MWRIRSRAPRRRCAPQASRRRWLLASSTALSAALLAGCGGGQRVAVEQPALPADVAGELAARSDAVAARLQAGDGCGALAAAQKLRARAIDAVNAGSVPPALQEELLGAVNAVAAGIACAPPPAEDGDDEGHGKGKAKGKRAKKEKDD